MLAIKALLLASVAVVYVTAQANIVSSNRCLALLSGAYKNPKTLQDIISRCLKTAQNYASSGLTERQMQLLVGRCVANGLGYLAGTGINKANVKRDIARIPNLSQEQKNYFNQAVDRCNDFDTCLSRECDVL